MLTTEQFAGLILMLLIIIALIIYNAWLSHTLNNQTLVIEDLVFENRTLKQVNSAQRKTIGNLTDKVQVAELEQWGNDAAESDTAYVEAFRLDKP